jgi:hypothetical protein
MGQQPLRLLIRENLADGRLPHDSIPRVWGGAGNGEVRDACGLVIDKTQFVMEGISTNVSKRAVQFHVKCFTPGRCRCLLASA